MIDRVKFFSEKCKRVLYYYPHQCGYCSQPIIFKFGINECECCHKKQEISILFLSSNYKEEGVYSNNPISEITL